MNDRRLALGLLATTAVVVLLVAFDIGGPVRGVVTLGFALVAPGLALSLVMGPMSIEARLLVAAAASAALVTIVALGLVAVGVWSGALAITLLAAFVSTLAVWVLRRSPDDGPIVAAADRLAHPQSIALSPSSPRRNP